MTAPIDLRVSEQNADADETSSKRGTDEWREGKRAWLDDPAPPEVVDARPGLESNATIAATFTSRITDNLVRVGINYKFDPRLAVVASY